MATLGTEFLTLPFLGTYRNGWVHFSLFYHVLPLLITWKWMNVLLKCLCFGTGSTDSVEKKLLAFENPFTWIHVPNIFSCNINAVVHWYITHMWWNSWIHCKYIRFKFMGNQSKSCLSKLFLPHFYEFLEHIEIILGNFCVVLLGNNNSNITNEHSILHDPEGNSISNQGGVLHMGLRGEKTIA